MEGVPQPDPDGSHENEENPQWWKPIFYRPNTALCLVVGLSGFFKFGVGPSKNSLFVVVFGANAASDYRDYPTSPPDPGRERVTCLKFKQRGLIFLGDYPPWNQHSTWKPEKWWLENYFPVGNVTFQGLCWTSGGYRKTKRNWKVQRVVHSILCSRWVSKNEVGMWN